MIRVPLRLVLAVFVGACGKPAGLPQQVASEPLRVVEWQPGAELARLDAALSFKLDRDMVAVDAVGPVLEVAPVVITPAVPLRVHWEDRRTLRVQPETAWRAGQRYRLRLLRSGAFERLAEPHEFVFDAQPLRLQQVALPRANVPRKPSFDAWFNLPVQIAQAAERCVLAGGNGQRVALTARPARDAPPGTTTGLHVYFDAQAELPRSTRFMLDCAGLTPAQGDAPWRAQPDAAGWTTHGLLEVSATWPASARAEPPERAELCLELTTPVASAQLAQHVHVTPAPEGLAKGWYEGRCNPAPRGDDEYREENGTDRANSVLLAPRRHYKVTLAAGLTDVFGQQLGKARSYEFDTADRLPGLWTATGPAEVLEAGRAEHAAGTLNVASAELRCLPLSAAQLAAAYPGITRWIYQGDYVDPDTGPPPSPWQVLGVAPRVQVMDATASANQARTLALDLGASCRGRSAAGKPGVYALELLAKTPAGEPALQGDVPARMLANVTDLALISKRGARSGLVWVSRLATGALVEGAAVEWIDAQGRLLARATSDARGLARFDRLPLVDRGELVSVRAGDDVAVVGDDSQWGDGLRSWQLGVREAYGGDVRLFVHTDRGVYRPGERVFVHGLARRIGDRARARVPEQRAVSLELRADNDLLLSRTLELSEFGSFATEIALPAHVAPGSHSLSIEVAGQREYHTIQVAEFRPLTFELTGGPARSELLSGERVQLDLSARYLFGTPLVAADVQFTVERTLGRIDPPGLEDFRFEDEAPALPNEEPWPKAPEGILLERAASTDAAGRAQLKFVAEAIRRPVRYAIHAAATDEAKDRATRSFSVLAHSAERYPGTQLARSVFGAEEPIAAAVVLVDRSGKPVAGEADVELRHELWDCSDPVARCRVEVRVLESQHVQIAAERPTKLTFAPTQARGSLHVRTSTRDAAGRIARSSDSAYVWSEQGTGPYNDRVAATLSVDRRRYRIGDQARLALETPLAPAHFLVTSERGELLSAAVVPRSAGMPVVALDAASAPNVFVTMSGLTPRAAAGEAGRPRLVSGARELTVEGPSRALEAKITLERERYEPRQRVQGTVVVTHLGKPVAAEVALVAVNESVLLLTGFQTPDPTQVFHAARGLSVHTMSNITRVIADPAKAAAVPETARVGTPGEDGGGGKPELRDDYVAAAYVAPDLRTDARGRVQFSFDAPTDLSAYRLMAVVAAKDDRVGSSEARMTVAQPLSAHLLAPRFVSRGDTLELGARVHDATGRPGATDVRFSAVGLTLDKPVLQLMADPAGSLAYTRASVLDLDAAYFEVELHKGEQADRVRHTLRVRRPLDRELRVLASERAARSRAKLAWPKGIDPALSKLEITVDRAGLAGLAPVLAMVVDYPYGCTEQTAAALASIAAAPERARAFMPSLSTAEGLNARIADGIARLIQARAPGGGFGLYPGMSGRSWLTALVLEAGLALRASGFSVPDALTGEAASQLARWLAEQNVAKLSAADLQRAAHASLLLARSGTLPDSVLDALHAKRAELSVDGSAHLLQAGVLARKPEAWRAPLRAALLPLHWLERKRDWNDPFGSAERTTAIALLALTADGQAPAEREQLAQRLIMRATDPAVYLSTRDAADVLTALAGWARGREAGAGNVRIGLGPQVHWQGSLAGAQVVALERSASEAADGDVWIEAEGGDVSVSIRRRDVSPSAPKPAFARGLSLERRYLDPKTAKPLSELSLGQIVQVELELRSEQPLRMVALEDPMAAGLEPLDPGLSSGASAGCDRCSDLVGFDHLQRRDDRIEAFAEWLPAGTHTLRYQLRATTRGTFSAPGATATLMYLPNLYARSRVGTVQVR